MLFQIDECLEKVLGTTDFSFATFFASCHLPDRRRDGHTYRLENFAAGTETFATDGECFPPVFNRDLLEGLEVLLDVGPFETVPRFLQPTIQLLPDDQGQEAAKNMTPDGFIQLMKNGPSIQNRLHVTEYLLHLPEFLVLEGHLLRRQRRIRFENPLPVVASLFLYLIQIDGDGLTIKLQVLTVALVTHKRLWIGL